MNKHGFFLSWLNNCITLLVLPIAIMVLPIAILVLPIAILVLPIAILVLPIVGLWQTILRYVTNSTNQINLR